MEVEEKIEEMQKFIPCIHLLIENLQKDPEKDGQVKKMEYLLDMLTRKDNSIKMDTLLKCESILVKIYGREKQFVTLMESENPKLGKDDNEQIDEPQSEEEQKEETETTLNESSKVEKPEIGAEIEAEAVKPSNERAPKIEADSKTTVAKSSKEEEQKEETKKSSSTQENIAQEESHGENDEVDNSSVTAIKLAAEDKPKFGDDSKDDAAATTVENSQNDSKEEAMDAEIENKKDDKNTVETVTKTVGISAENTGDIKIENICGTENEEDAKDDEICATEINNSQTAKKKTKANVVEDSQDGHAGVDKPDAIKENCNEKADDSKTEAKMLAPKENGIQANDTTCDMEIDEELTNVSSQTCPEIETPKATQTLDRKQLATSTDSTKEETQLPTNKEAQKSSNIVDLTSDDDEPSTTNAKSTTKAATPKTNITPSNITTIDLLDSDSDDEAARKVTKNTSPAELKMPTPKIVTQPMFTISSVQSINDSKMQADAVHKQLIELVKAVQYSSYHTVPYKYNTAVRVYLEKFIRDLMFEKNRVNLCLQKLQKAVDFDKYKGFKKIIQSYCSEPVNDPNLPAPSPLCHRIKVYPEKLQWVMRRTFFSENKITVIGYKVYSLEHNHANTNGVRRVNTTPTKTPPSKPVQPLKTVQPSKTVQPGKTMQGSATKTIQPAKTMQPAKPSFPDKSFTNLSNFSDPLLIPSRIVDATDTISNDSNSNTGSDLVTPTRCDSRRRRSSSNKNRRRKRTDDDDDDDNYVPHDPVEVTAESRRVSLQRASKARCQRYLESTAENGKIDDIISDKASEYHESSESEEERRPKTPPPPRPAPRLAPRPAPQPNPPPKKVRKRITPKRKVPEELTEKVSETVIDPQVAEPVLKRTRGEQTRAEMGEDDDAGELPPNKNTMAKWKNIWSGFHCQSKFMDRCLICHERTKDNLLITHYVNQHRNRDVFISRLTKSDVMKIQSETMNFAFPAATKSSIATFVAYCFFCRAENCLSIRSWFEHYTRHTGEYVFECSNCAMRKSRLAHCKKHVKSECPSSKKNSEVIVLFELEAEATKIDAYICRLCNFVQLRFDNLVRHLRSEHEISGDISDEHFCAANLFDTAQPFYGDPYGGEYGNVEDMSASFTGEFGQDDMSFMICNKLANPVGGQAAANSDLVPKDSQGIDSKTSTAEKEMNSIAATADTNSTEADSSAKDDNVEPLQFLPSHGDESHSNNVSDDVSTSAAIVESTNCVLDEKSGKVNTNMEADIESMIESSQIPTMSSVVESSATDNSEIASSLAESAQPVDDVIFEITEMEVDIHNL